MKFVEGNILCSAEDSKNIIEYEKKFYQLRPLVNIEDINGGKGGNSNVFVLLDNEFDKEYILKFCKYSLSSDDPSHVQRIKRFKNEIMALKKAKEKKGIVNIIFNDALKIGNNEFLFYVMEKGDGDLLDFLMNNEIDYSQKIVIILDLIDSLIQLHDIEVYHRDIKPDNIFFINNKPKIGDLGLAQFRNQDQTLDTIREKIGPSGWLSPEAVNKMLCEGTKNEDKHCCIIQEYSDIFQLGKLIWFILEGTAPIGHTQFEDFKFGNKKLYRKLTEMLQYNNTKRPKLIEVRNLVSKISYA